MRIESYRYLSNEQDFGGLKTLDSDELSGINILFITHLGWNIKTERRVRIKGWIANLHQCHHIAVSVAAPIPFIHLTK